MSKKVLSVLKESHQDFEWYPTTREMITCVYNDIALLDQLKPTKVSMLDVGAGNGKVFTIMDELSSARGSEREHMTFSRRYAIEKSPVLIGAMPSNVFIVGTDFWEQSLIDKKVDVLFSNPPYSEYERWSTKVIREANAGVVYLVVPKRWSKSALIADAIKSRSAEASVLGSFDFASSEDRAARAKVDVVKIALTYRSYYSSGYFTPITDPFKLWFTEHFPVNIPESAPLASTEACSKRERLHALVKGGNLAERLEELYSDDLNSLIETYQKISSLEPQLLKELGVDIHSLREGMKLKISGLKNLYWKELFDNMDAITSRLTAASRTAMLDTLMSNTSVDFTVANAKSIALWAIKNANLYFDEQLLNVYWSMSSPDSVRLYKSNRHLVKDGWRYERTHATHYALDYRIVYSLSTALTGSRSNSKYGNGLTTKAAETIEDLITIAKNLGFNVATKVSDIEHWEAGVSYDFVMGGKQIFAKIRAFQNGNIHFRFHQKFIRAFNLEAARLNKWIKSPEEAVDEFDITKKEAQTMFGANFSLMPSALDKLLPSSVQIAS